jgi:hypothetical protein
MFGLMLAGSYPLTTLPVKAFSGIVMCLLYERTGSLLPGIALHSLIDASGFEVALTNTLMIIPTVFLLLTTWRLVKRQVAQTGRPIPRRPSSRKPTVHFDIRADESHPTKYTMLGGWRTASTAGYTRH